MRGNGGERGEVVWWEKITQTLFFKDDLRVVSLHVIQHISLCNRGYILVDPFLTGTIRNY